MDTQRWSELLDWDACHECAECLLQCQYLDLTPELARAEVRNLRSGRWGASRVADECIRCAACDAFCPRGAHPFERLAFPAQDEYRREGLPRRSSYLLPLQQPNVREELPFTAHERGLHRQWGNDAPPARVCLYPGCNLLATPRLAEGRLFENLPVWGRWDLCCGEMFWRLGLTDTVERQARRLQAFYSGKPIDELVFACPAGYNMFAHILPDHFGIHFEFSCTSLTDWLLASLERGEIALHDRLTGSLTIHDSCHGRLLGPDFMERQRELLTVLGLSVEDTAPGREHGLCCGIAAGCRSFSAVDLVRHGRRALQALDRAPGREAVTYCTGCYLVLNVLRLTRPWGKRVGHVLEYVRRALGEDVPDQRLQRSAQLVAGIARNALPHYFSKERIFLE